MAVVARDGHLYLEHAPRRWARIDVHADTALPLPGAWEARIGLLPDGVDPIASDGTVHDAISLPVTADTDPAYVAAAVSDYLAARA
jgi:hypothetical protein